ncbi:MAG: polysaccharide deacetylase family protein [Gemmatimonadales bacterium]
MPMRGVLTYHSIDRTGSVISVTPAAFRAHVEWLAAGDVPVVSLSRLLELPDDASALALTFDDGLTSVMTEAAPLLAAHGLPATVFVVSRHVGGDNQWNGIGDPGVPIQPVLGWEALGRLRDQGFTIGAHTRHHRHLTHCSHDELAEELGGSSDDIATALGDRPTVFAYPYGAVDERVAHAAAAQFAIACTTDFQPVRTAGRRDLVPRLDAWYFHDVGRLRRWGTPRLCRAIAARHIMRRVRRAWR